MTLDITLLFNAIAISVMFAAMAMVRGGAAYGSWFVVHCGIIAVGVIAYIGDWPGAGYWLFAVSMVLVIVPSVLQNRAAMAEVRGSQALAVRLYWLAAIFHPSRMWRFNARRAAALGNPTIREKCAALERLALSSEPDQAAALRLIAMRMRSDWDGILALPAPNNPFVAPLFLSLKIMALGQLGRLGDMISLFQANRQMIEGYPGSEQVLMAIFVFCGKSEAVDRLLQSKSFAALPETDRQWTRYFAKLVSGQSSARAILEGIAAAVLDADKRVSMEKRLSTPLVDPGSLPPELAAVVDQLAKGVLQKPLPTRKKLRHFPATLALIALNLAAYGAQMSQGNPQNLRVLVELGGMWPPFVADGEWWRIFASLFLHAGPLHLLLNMAVLASFGYAIEQRSGSWRVVVLYCVGGTLSSLFVFMLMQSDVIGMAVLVGASGAIFALFGGLVADAISRWKRTRQVEDRQRIIVLALLLVLQTVFDFLIPMVSFAAHLGGLVAGFGIGAIFNSFKR